MGKFKGGKKPVKKVVKKKLSNPCAKNNGAFKFVARMHKSKICYNKAAYAKSGSGPCGSWCTLDVKVGSGCGNNKTRLCPSVKKGKKPAAKKPKAKKGKKAKKTKKAKKSTKKSVKNDLKKLKKFLNKTKKDVKKAKKAVKKAKSVVKKSKKT